MKPELSSALDFIRGTTEIAEMAHEKTSEFHENYVSKILPDCGKYGDAAKFLAEMAPGVSEYNAIKDGDWKGFCVAAGIDVAAVSIGALTAGTGYAAVKGGSTAAKAGAKIAVKEVAEAGAKAAVKEVAEAGAEKIAKEVVEAGVEKAAREVVEAGVEKATKEVVEAGAEKIANEVVEAGIKKAAKEVVEAGVEKATKEAVETGVEKAVKEVAEAGIEKTAKEIVETGAVKATREVAEVGAEKTAKEVAEAEAEKVAKEVGEKLQTELFSEYLQEVEKITGREIKPSQLDKVKEALEKQDFVKLDKGANELHRKEFERTRNQLIREWETNVGEKWPTYATSVINEEGAIIRQSGRPYDAHHLIESGFGGPNEWWNLHPAAFPDEHQAGIHAAGSIANKIF